MTNTRFCPCCGLKHTSLVSLRAIGLHIESPFHHLFFNCTCGTTILIDVKDIDNWQDIIKHLPKEKVIIHV